MAKDPEYHVAFIKTESGLKGWAVFNRKGKEVYFNESKHDVNDECEVRNARHEQKLAKKKSGENRLTVAVGMAEAYVQSIVKRDFKGGSVVSIHTFKDKQGGIRVSEVSVTSPDKQRGYSFMRSDATKGTGDVLLAVEDFILTYDIKPYRPRGWESDIDEHGDARFKLDAMLGKKK